MDHMCLQSRRKTKPQKEVTKIVLNAESKVTGEELFRYFLMGDHRAFEELVALYEEELFYFINRMVDDYHEAKHLTIEAFAQLAVGGQKFSGKSSLKTYLFAMGKNLALRNIKMRGRAKHISYEEIMGVLSDEGTAPHSFIEREETKQQFHEALKDLEDEHRAVILLLYFEDLSYIQAGRVMNKSEKQIKQLAGQAKAALQKKLESEQ